MSQKKVSIIIVSYNVADFMELCLDSVFKAIKNISAEVIVIDNASSDNSVEVVQTLFSKVIIIANNENVGFSKANNQGIAVAKGAYIHFLNPDTVITEDFYEKTLVFMDANPNAGALGPRIINSRGKYSLDSKKSFPSFWTSVSKVLGLSKVFPRSKLFNKYYAAEADEFETASVDILSGCCLLVRKTALKHSGGGFDEQYFMYCEDVDLCHRLTQNGFKNYYFPEVTIIHYKGESTRKLSLHYMKIFYQAHTLFVKKYYPPKHGYIYITALKAVLILRNVFSYFRYFLSIFKLFLIDAVLLVLVLLLFTDFWQSEITPGIKIPREAVYTVLPLYIGIWIGSLLLNGAYDKPYSQYKAGRGMIWGIVIVLASYGLLPPEYRFSRGVILFSGMVGIVILLLARWFLAVIGWIKLVPRGKVDYHSVIVGNEEDYKIVKEKLKAHNYRMEIDGRIAAVPNDKSAIDYYGRLYEVQQTFRLSEIIFCAQSMSYKSILQSIEACSQWSYFKIVPAGNRVIVSSNLSKSNPDLFALNKEYILDTPQARRNKRITDIITSLAVLILFPVLMFLVKNKSALLQSAIDVIVAKKTWIGYTSEIAALAHLPKIRRSVFPPYQLVNGYTPGINIQVFLSKKYAAEYDSLDDMRLIWSNLKYLDKVVRDEVESKIKNHEKAF